MSDRDDMKLTTPRLRVMLGDGTVTEVQATNADLVRWDFTRAKHKWPTLREAPFLWQTFVAWSALRRTKGPGGDMTWEAFSDSAQAVEDLTDPDPQGADAVDPTSPGAEPDSSSQLL